VRAAARALGGDPFIIAKIERAGALANIAGILDAADGVMVARGDLGVEVPIERIALTQKSLIARANMAGKPVITATQMLESMVASRLPTRAEATDVANAILDGTDAVMLSAESAMGRYPEAAVAMLAGIASETERGRPGGRVSDVVEYARTHRPVSAADAMSTVIEHALQTVPCNAVFVPTRTGTRARLLARFRPDAWIVAFAAERRVCQALAFSYGVHPVQVDEATDDWLPRGRAWLEANGLQGRTALLVSGPSPAHPDAPYRIEFMAPGR
jgi:pyruvate kinase